MSSMIQTYRGALLPSARPFLKKKISVRAVGEPVGSVRDVCEVATRTGHNYVGHNYLGHNYIGCMRRHHSDSSVGRHVCGHMCGHAYRHVYRHVCGHVYGHMYGHHSC